VATRAAYQVGDQMFYADSCEPLTAATNAGEIMLHALVRDHYPGTPLNAGVLEGVKSVGFWDTSSSQRWGLDWHRNEGIEITYLSRGQLGFAVDGTEHTLPQGAVTITRPWQSHRVGLPHVNASRLHWLILDVDVRRPNQTWCWPDWLVLSPGNLEHLTRLLQHNEYPVWRGDNIGETFEALALLIQDPYKPTWSTRIAILINQLFVELLETLEQQTPFFDEELTSSRRSVGLFLEDLALLAGEPWTLESMADACNLGRSQFTQYCREITNMTPVQYLTACRIELAQKVLHDMEDVSITYVAELCGFDSSQYFSTVFRRVVGVPPSLFKKHRAHH
jgi:AraC-like DNA-binding protein/quercetin dioxygenase-like cupin family protein